MEQSKIDRINELAAKKKAGETLTEEELSEQKALREEFLAGFRRNMTATLENTYIQRPDGSKEKLRRRDEGDK